jgi:hypothetical protein
MIVDKYTCYCQMCDISVCPICHFSSKNIEIAENYVCKKCDAKNGIEFAYRGDKICVDFVN